MRCFPVRSMKKKIISPWLCNDIAEFVDVNPSASINNIIGEFGTPEKHADVFLENKMKDKPETIRKRLVFHRVIAIAAVLVVAIIGIVYACALIENHWINKGYDTESIENEEVVILQTDERD